MFFEWYRLQQTAGTTCTMQSDSASYRRQCPSAEDIAGVGCTRQRRLHIHFSRSANDMCCPVSAKRDGHRQKSVAAADRCPLRVFCNDPWSAATVFHRQCPDDPRVAAAHKTLTVCVAHETVAAACRIPVPMHKSMWQAKFCQWKNYEKRLAFGEVTDRTMGLTYLGHPVYDALYTFQYVWVWLAYSNMLNVWINLLL